jgi:hypothetical protein
LKLKLEGVSNVGTAKFDFVLTKDIKKVCDFLSVPYFCLDGKTRISSQDIFEILTTCRLYFNNNNYDQKYKIKERRKRRPVADTFFTSLEEGENDSELEVKNAERFQDDKVYTILLNYRNKKITYNEYIEQISDCFGRKEEVTKKWELMREQSQTISNADLRFNFYVLKEWFPQEDQVKLGKVLGRMKSSKSGSGTNNFQLWITETDIEDIRALADESFRFFDA